MLIQADYEQIRHRIRAGDGFAFDGDGFVSRAIRFFSGGPSHWATVFESHEPERRVKLIESTTLNNVKGVQFNYASDRIKTYQGKVWWLPLSAEHHCHLDSKAFTDFLQAQIGKGYDYRVIAHMAVDVLQLVALGEDWNKFVCSELGAASLKIGRILPAYMNTSEITPAEMCRFKIWHHDYYQLKGKPSEIRKFNTVESSTFKN